MNARQVLQCNEYLYNHLAKLYGGNHYNYRAVMRKEVHPKWRRYWLQILPPKTLGCSIQFYRDQWLSRRERPQQHYIKSGEPIPDYAAAALEYISFTLYFFKATRSFALR